MVAETPSSSLSLNEDEALIDKGLISFNFVLTSIFTFLPLGKKKENLSFIYSY